MKENKIYFKSKKIFLLFTITLLFLLLAYPAFAQQQSITFVLGKKGQSGCLVCHGDKDLAKVTPEGKKSLYVSPVIYGSSVHKDVPCQSCHLSFTTEPHQQRTIDYRKEAGLACAGKNCHSDILKTYSKSIHGKLALSSNSQEGATCGDCHGSHAIQKAKSKTFRASARQSCGSDRCHNNPYLKEKPSTTLLKNEEKLKEWKLAREFWNNYDDHYHGRPYKLGEPDAPPCWDCHGAHEITKIGEADSPVGKTNLWKRCNKCHMVVSREDKSFLQYATLIHSRKKITEENFLMSLFAEIGKRVKAIVKWFTNL